MEVKTSLERVRAFRARAKANKESKVPASAVERSRKYRARQRELKKICGQQYGLDNSVPSSLISDNYTEFENQTMKSETGTDDPEEAAVAEQPVVVTGIQSNSNGVITSTSSSSTSTSSKVSLNAHLIQLLLYYRSLLRHSYPRCMPNGLLFKLERTMFQNLEQHFNKLLDFDLKKILELSSLTEESFLLERDLNRGLSIRRLSHQFDTYQHSIKNIINVDDNDEIELLKDNNIGGASTSAPDLVLIDDDEEDRSKNQPENNKTVLNGSKDDSNKKRFTSMRNDVNNDNGEDIDHNNNNNNKKHKKTISSRSSSVSFSSERELSSRSSSSSESDNTIVDHDFKVKGLKKNKKSSPKDDSKLQTSKSLSTEPNTANDEYIASSLATNRPRRSCTLKSQPIYSPLPMSVLKKNALETILSFQKSKNSRKSLNNNNNNNETSSTKTLEPTIIASSSSSSTTPLNANYYHRRPTYSSHQNVNSHVDDNSVEELVVNCDPFNLIDSSGTHAINTTPTTSTMPRALVSNSIRNRILNIDRNNSSAAAASAPSGNILVKGASASTSSSSSPSIVSSYIVSNGISCFSTGSVNTAATNNTNSAPTLIRLPQTSTLSSNGKLPQTLIITNNNNNSPNIGNLNIAGKSLGKILLINSKPFFIQNGNSISLPTINQQQNVSSVMMNRLASAIKMGNVNVATNSGGSTTQRVVQSIAAPSTSTATTTNKKDIKVEVVSDHEDEDNKDNVRKEIERLKGIQNGGALVNLQNQPKKLGKASAAPPPPQTFIRNVIQKSLSSQSTTSTTATTSNKSLPFSIRIVSTTPNNSNSTTATTSSLPSTSSLSSSSAQLDLLRRIKLLASNSKASSGGSSASTSTNQSDQPDSTKSKQARLNSVFEALAKAKAAQKTKELLSMKSAKEANGGGGSGGGSTSAQYQSSLSKSYPCNLKPYSERIAKKTELIDQLRLRSHIQSKDIEDKRIIVFRSAETNVIIGYKCNYEDCSGYVTARRDKILAHIRSRHGNAQADSGTSATTTAATSSNANGTFSSNNNNNNLITSTKQFTCDLCSKKFKLKEYLTLHQRIAHSSTPSSSSSSAALTVSGTFRCTTPGCDRQFTRRKSLHSHIANHYYEKPFVCNQLNCAKRFIYSFQLKEHLRAEHGIVTAETNNNGEQLSSEAGTSAVKSSEKTSNGTNDSDLGKIKN